MTIIISPNERDNGIKEIMLKLDIEFIEENLPFDILLYTDKGKVAIERKAFPNDFVASAMDGRFAKECAAMREETKFQIILIEGEGRYTVDNKLKINNMPSKWTKEGIRNLRRSLKYVEGCDIEDTESMEDTVKVICELQKYFNEKHVSLHRRQVFESNWLHPMYNERFIFWLQGCGKGISVSRAGLIASIFHNPFEIARSHAEGILYEKLTSIYGIGDKVANSFIEFWEGC